MSKFYAKLNASLQEFIRTQKIFFTATAPEDGRINLSPKGMDTFHCIDDTTVAYLDLTGSGNETAAHLSENGRITVMFCSFTEEPLILRLYGAGRAVLPRHADWSAFHAHFQPVAGERQIIVIEIQAVQTSCGYAVPVYDLKEERQKLVQWAERKGEAGIQKYWHEKNRRSIDGLPTGLLE
ncbi:MAG: pyridoxamine 5'-phosphate oxidase family protein [Gemmatimonadaceae bacterium]|nr:pyridoxamine 5'-phosphate oxidase family protein [Gloeobacterales cyanobacterium ES-bin-141]